MKKSLFLICIFAALQMAVADAADVKITDMTELSVAPATDDMLVLVDVSDTTDAATGTTKQISVDNLLQAGTDELSPTEDGLIGIDYDAGGSSATAVTIGDGILLNPITWVLSASGASRDPVIGDPDSWSPVTADYYGGTFVATAAGTMALPSVVAGMNFTVITQGAVAVVINPDDGDLIVLDGTALADGDSITNGATAGDMAVCQYYNSTGWACQTNGWTDTN